VNTSAVALTGGDFTIEDVVAVARDGAKVALTEDAAARVERSQRLVQEMINRGEVIYGVTTGLADHKGMRVDPAEVEAFQQRIVLGHVVGFGRTLPADIVRAIILLVAAQAVDLLGKVRLGAGTRRVYGAVRRDIPFLVEDAPLAPLVETLELRVRSGEILDAVEASPLR